MSKIGMSLTSFVAGAALASGISVMAASGDLVYEAPAVRVEIPQARAAVYASLAVDDGAWSGALADIDRVCVVRRRIDDAPDLYFVDARGRKSVAPGSLSVGPGGVKIVDVVE